MGNYFYVIPGEDPGFLPEADRHGFPLSRE